ncbi:MAG: chromosome partitioning protein ParB family [Caulobacteraceae bacterium]|nr:MAG: chromosome partitioning protein ParB family [Caulobacteraceae bacterium]
MDKLVRFVSVDAYKEAGGVCVSDLFAEEESEDTVVWLTDRDLLVRLVESKLSNFADEAQSEGWAWVEIAIDGVAWTQFPERVRDRRPPLMDEQSAEQDRLLAMLDETKDEADIEALEEQIDALTVIEWNVSEVAVAGAIVTLAHDGAVRIERGLVRVDDAKKLRALRKRAQDVSAVSLDKEPGEDPSADEVRATEASNSASNLPRKLVDELMAHKTLALRAEVAARPDLALRLTVLALASNAFGNDYASFSLVRLKADEIDIARQISRCETKAPEAYATLLNAWKERLASDTDDLWAFVSDADTDKLLELLAILVAPAIELQPGRAPDVTDAICEAEGLDMNQYWQATPASFFDHVRRDVLLEAIREFKPTALNAKLEKASKKEVVARAKRIF